MGVRGVRPARWKASRTRAEAGREASTKAVESAGLLSAKGAGHLTAPQQRVVSSMAGSPQARLSSGTRASGDRERKSVAVNRTAVVEWASEGVARVGAAREGDGEHGG